MFISNGIPNLQPSIITTDSSDEIKCCNSTIIIREKVLIVGDAIVGKSALLHANLKNNKTGNIKDYDFSDYMMTTFPELNVIEISNNDDINTIDLFVYDIPGQIIMKQSLDDKLKISKYSICMFDISSRKSFLNCINWIKFLNLNDIQSSDNNMCGLLVGNKIDLRQESVDSRCEVDTSEAESFAKEHGLKYFECSVLLNRDVDHPFRFIAQQVMKTYNNGQK